MNREDHGARLRRLLLSVDTPAQYLGGEVGQVVKPRHETDQRWALLFPDTYAIGMSHLGIRVLYGILNGIPGVAAERCFAPWFDMEAALRGAGLPLLTLETHSPVREFDVVGFTLQYELSYGNVLAMLDLAGIPLLAAARGEGDPLVLGGGVGAFHPEPVADFFDAFLLGDGEDAVPEMVRVLREARGARLPRRETLLELARRVTGVYVPVLYEVRRRGDGSVAEVVPAADGVPSRVLPACAGDFENGYAPTATPVPFVKVTQDRICIEVMRGCTQGCRFCQAGMTKRPSRVRSAARVLAIAREAYRATGHDEISLLSLSTADYPHLDELVALLDAEFREKRVGLAVPSLRVGETLRLIPSLFSGVRKTGLTIAPEAASDRLRAVINKNVRNEDLFRGVSEIWRQGWRAVKLYFMVGLPTETDDDVDGIIEMARQVSDLGRGAGGPAEVTASVSNFVPKPHTPFAWEPMDTEETLLRKRERLYGAVKRHRRVRLRVHDAGMSVAEAVLARGDRRVGGVLLRLFRAGARFDSWDEHFSRDRFFDAVRDEGLDVAPFVHRRVPDGEALPWDHLGAPVTREYLAAERDRARAGERTPDCMAGRCARCGADVAACAPARQAFREAGRGTQA